MKKKKIQNYLLPIGAGIVVIAALAVTLIPRLTGNKADVRQPSSASAASSGDLVIQIDGIGSDASYFDFDANGTTVQVFAVKASDGTVRLALNTCQVCSGSPYAYFEQAGNTFICQNCKNRFASTEVGIIGGGCRPIPITSENCTEQDGFYIIPAAFLNQYAALFENWKKF